MPPFRLEPHDIGTLVGSLRGDPIAVDGSAGLILRLYNQDIPPVFAHGSNFQSAFPELKQVVVLGDLEGQADIAIGLGQLQARSWASSAHRPDSSSTSRPEDVSRALKGCRKSRAE